MELYMIEQKTYEAMKERFEKFAQEVEELCEDQKIDGNWLDNQDVCRLLHISKRTLQYYRDSGMVPFSRIVNKCYYKASDLQKLIDKSKVK
ncbi:MAG: helix-turn-helix domain-containing protein [Alistipes sp.]|nr:helix-turn-helix domain-containing protein [Alistipes sp.]